LTVVASPVGVAVDQSVSATGTGTVSTAPLSTSGPRLLVAFVAAAGADDKQTSTVSGGGLTWTLAQSAKSKGGAVQIWTAQAAAPLAGAAFTSTPLAAGGDQQVTVVAFTGAAGVGATAAASSAKSAPSVSLTTTAAGSLVYAVGLDAGNAVGRSVGPGQSLAAQWVDSAADDTFWVQDQNTAVPAAGTAVTLGDPSPVSALWSLAAAEIVPAEG
jgi:hypothetical protein